MTKTKQYKNQKMIYALAVMSADSHANKYEEYEYKKHQLHEKCLSSEEYEKEIRQLIKEVGI